MAKIETSGSLALHSKECRVIKIEADKARGTQKLRVAAYCRVSSSSEDQLNSFTAQSIHYTQYITANENWRLVDVYADEGITGTSMDKREDFKRMLADSQRGLIDRILVKSISRFARNTAECLECIRQLSANGTTVCFEKEGIDTSRMSSELMTALHAAFSQGESESISGNMRWSYQKRMERGEFNTYTAPVGYDLINGQLVINEEAAPVIRQIFEIYLSGSNTTEIADQLNQRKALGIYWQRGRIEYILRNERYAGDALLQKKYTTDTLPRRQVRNNGERATHYITGSNEAIVSKEMFRRAKNLLESRAKHIASEQLPFSGIVSCSCGSTYRVRRFSTERYWLCRRHDSDKDACAITQIPEVQIQQAFLRLYYNLRHQGSRILPTFLERLQAIRERRFLWSEDIISLNQKIADINRQVQLLAALKQSGCVDPDIFIAKSNAMAKQLQEAKQAKARVMDHEGDDTVARTKALISVLSSGPDALETFDAEMFGRLIDKITIESNTSLRFCLKNGLELRESIERTVR